MRFCTALSESPGYPVPLYPPVVVATAPSRPALDEADAPGWQPAAPPLRLLRILYQCGGAYVSGMEVIELAVMRGLVERGHAVHCIVSGWNDGDFIARLTEVGIPHTIVFTGKLSFSLHPRHVLWTLDALRRLPGAHRAVRRCVRAFVPDVVVACNRDSVLMLANALAPHPVVYHVHEAPTVTGKNRRVMAAIVRRCALLVGVSDFVRTRLVELGVPAGKVRVATNGVSRVELRPGQREPKPFTVGICGQVAPWKGHKDLIEALGSLYARGVEVRCLVFGKGAPEFEATLRRRADELGIGERVEWRGFVRDPDLLYGELDVLAVPSRVEETFGMVAAEAGMRGVPVIASRVGGLPEVVADGQSGYLIEAGRPDELALRIEELAADAALRQAMGAAARERILARFTTRRMVQQHEMMLLEAADRG